MKTSGTMSQVISMLLVTWLSIIDVQAGGAGSPPPKPSTGVLSEEVVRARLSAMGYGAVQAIEQKDQQYVIETVHDGRKVRITVDAVTGKINETSR